MPVVNSATMKFSDIRWNAMTSDTVAERLLLWYLINTVGIVDGAERTCTIDYQFLLRFMGVTQSIMLEEGV